MAIGISSHLDINSNQLGPSTTRHSPQQGYINSSSESSEYDSSDMDELVDNYESGMQRLTLRTDRTQPHNGTPFDRFHGQSSSIKLVDATRKLKQAHMMAHKEGLSSDSNSLSPSPDISNSLRRSEYWRAPSVGQRVRISNFFSTDRLSPVGAEIRRPPCSFAKVT